MKLLLGKGFLGSFGVGIYNLTFWREILSFLGGYFSAFPDSTFKVCTELVFQLFKESTTDHFGSQGRTIHGSDFLLPVSSFYLILILPRITLNFPGLRVDELHLTICFTTTNFAKTFKNGQVLLRITWNCNGHIGVLETSFI